MGTFNVYIDGTKVFNASGDKGVKWLKATVDVNLWGIYEVRQHSLVAREQNNRIHTFIIFTIISGIVVTDAITASRKLKSF